MTKIFWLGGAGDDSFLPNLIGPVRNGHDLVRVPYPGSIGPVNLTPNLYDWTQGISESRKIGKEMLEKAIRETNDVPWIAGYSLGAYVVSDLLDEISEGQHKELEIRGVITAGNPRRTVGGIAGSHKTWNPQIPHLELAAPNDLIANCPPKSILRKLPFFVDALTGMARPKASEIIISGLTGYNWALTERDIQLCWAYLDGTGHGTDYFTDGRHRAAVRHVLS